MAVLRAAEADPEAPREDGSRRSGTLTSVLDSGIDSDPNSGSNV